MPHGTIVRNQWMGGAKMDAIGFYGRNLCKAVYYDMLTVWVKQLIKRTKEEHFQNVIIVEGRTGSGKSTLAVQIAKLIDPKFRITDDYIYTVEDWERKIQRYRDGEDVSSVNLLDEGTVTFNSKNSLKKEDKKLVTMLQIMRSLNWTTIICVPRFKDINVSIRENLVDFRVMCPDKPLVKMSKIKQEDGSIKTVRYGSRGFFEVYRPKFEKFSEKQKDVFWILMGAGVYGDLDKDTKEEYERTKLDHQMSWLDNEMMEKKKKEKTEVE